MRAVVLILVLASCKAESNQPPQTAPAAAPTPAAAPSDAAVPPPGNVVQREMRLLTSILEGTVRGIGMGDVRPIEHQLHGLHEAKEATGAAVRSGAYKLPRQPENVAQFEALDEAFHEHLGALVVASRANDVPAAATALGAIMQGCHGCHSAFRGP